MTWRYRAFADPYQGMAGVEPVEGTVELVVRVGRIVAFTFASDEDSVTRRRRQFDGALNARIAAVAATPRASGPAARGPTTEPRPDPAGAPDARLVSGLAASVVGGLLIGVWRRRTRAG